MNLGVKLGAAVMCRIWGVMGSTTQSLMIASKLSSFLLTVRNVIVYTNGQEKSGDFKGDPCCYLYCKASCYTSGIPGLVPERRT